MKRLTIISIVIGGLLITPSTIGSQSGGPFSIDRDTWDSGGGISDGGVFSLHGTIAQHDAGNMDGGVYTLRGGFWVEAETDVLFEDHFE